MSLFDQYFKLRGVTINTTNDCNLQCSYCFERDKHKLNMTVDESKQIINKICEHFETVTLEEDPEASLGISFFGGEPLLNFNVIKTIVDITKEKPYLVKYGVTTNATILTDEMIDLFCDNNFGVLISIDGIETIHNKNRCNSYNKVVTNIKRLINADLGLNIEARITVPPSDVQYMFAGVKSVFDLGIDNIAPCLVFDQPWSEDEMKEFQKQADLIYDFTMKTYQDKDNKRNLNIKLVNDFIELCFGPASNSISPCGYGKNNWISIGPKGELASCHQDHTNTTNSKDVLLGNILTDELHVDKLLKIRNLVNSEREECAGCPHSCICKGGCPAENYREYNSYHALNKAWCDYVDIMHKIAIKYQDKILSASNIRNRRFNILKANLEFKKLIDATINLDINDDQFMLNSAKIQEFVFNNERILMPEFKKYAGYFTQIISIKVASCLNEIIKELPKEVLADV